MESFSPPPSVMLTNNQTGRVTFVLNAVHHMWCRCWLSIYAWQWQALLLFTCFGHTVQVILPSVRSKGLKYIISPPEGTQQEGTWQRELKNNWTVLSIYCRLLPCKYLTFVYILLMLKPRHRAEHLMWASTWDWHVPPFGTPIQEENKDISYLYSFPKTLSAPTSRQKMGHKCSHCSHGF